MTISRTVGSTGLKIDTYTNWGKAVYLDYSIIWHSKHLSKTLVSATWKQVLWNSLLTFEPLLKDNKQKSCFEVKGCLQGVRAYMCACVHVCMCVCMCVHVCACVRVCACVCAWVVVCMMVCGGGGVVVVVVCGVLIGFSALTVPISWKRNWWTRQSMIIFIYCLFFICVYGCIT